MLALYTHRASPIHRISAGVKLLVLLAVSILIFLSKPLWLLIAILLAIAALYRLAHLTLNTLASALRPLIFVGAFIFAFQLLLSGLTEAISIIVRIVSTILLASLVTLTTRFSDMLETITKIARPLARIGITPSKLALMISLTIRFIPILLHDANEVRQARLARGAKRLSVYGAGPLVVKTLRMTESIGDAIASRGFESRE